MCLSQDSLACIQAYPCSPFLVGPLAVERWGRVQALAAGSGPSMGWVSGGG